MISTEAGAESGGSVPASLALEEQLCFALYSASRAVVKRYRPILSELGLTYPQYLVMLVLWEHGVLPIKDVGAALSLDYGTLTPLLKRLEAQGLIWRERQADDERSVQVVLTGQGEALRERALAVPEAIGEAMNLSPEEIAGAQAFLKRLTANVCAPDPRP